MLVSEKDRESSCGLLATQPDVKLSDFCSHTQSHLAIYDDFHCFSVIFILKLMNTLNLTITRAHVTLTSIPTYVLAENKVRPSKGPHFRPNSPLFESEIIKENGPHSDANTGAPTHSVTRAQPPRMLV